MDGHAGSAASHGTDITRRATPPLPPSIAHSFFSPAAGGAGGRAAVARLAVRCRHCFRRETATAHVPGEQETRGGRCTGGVGTGERARAAATGRGHALLAVGRWETRAAHFGTLHEPHPRRPAGDGQRRLSARSADQPQEIRRGRGHPRRRRPAQRVICAHRRAHSNRSRAAGAGAGGGTAAGAERGPERARRRPGDGSGVRGKPAEQVGVHALEWIHLHKTAALLRFSVMAGAILAGADADDVQHMEAYANRIGLAFQIADDVLDVVSSTETLGKTAGKDSAVDKATFPRLLGLEASRLRAEQLVHEAKQALERYGGRAGILLGLADFIIQRKN
eukprot:ctg_29.g13